MNQYDLFNEESSNFEEPKVVYGMPIPKILIDIAEHLQRQNVLLSKQFVDGRINASINENELIKEIQKKFDIQLSKVREWYDFAIEDKKEFYPVNIKITDTTHADNLNCKLGIYYALTGMLPDFPNGIGWLPYFEKLKENLGKDETKDYFFLVFNKQNPADIFVNTLKGLQTLQPNGNNLPFQCKWDNNRKYKKRSFTQAKKYILKVFGESIKQRAEIYFNFKKYFPEYV
jgi:hypothetical protein